MQLYVDNRPQSVAEFLELLKGSKDLRDPKASNEEDLIDDVDVEVTVLPDERVLRTDNRVQRVNPKAVEADNEEPRAVEKETERATSKINDPVAKPKKNHTALVAVVVLLGILVGGGLFFAFLGGNDRLAAHSEEPATTVVIEDTEDEIHDYYMFMNEMIVHCDCEMGDFIPNKTREIIYKYSGRCKRRDGK